MRLTPFTVFGLGIVVLVSMATPALAGNPSPVPEIDGASLSAGIGLLAAGVLLVRARMKSK